MAGLQFPDLARVL